MADELRVADGSEYLNPVIEERIQYIVIRLGAEYYGIDIKHVDNIVRMQPITRVPHVANYITGVINLRGEVIPVINLRLKMNLEEVETTKASRIIILKIEEFGTLGFIVDEVSEVVTLSTSDTEKIAHDASDEKQNFVFAVGKTEDGLISLLDMNVVCREK